MTTTFVATSAALTRCGDCTHFDLCPCGKCSAGQCVAPLPRWTHHEISMIARTVLSSHCEPHCATFSAKTEMTS